MASNKMKDWIGVELKELSNHVIGGDWGKDPEYEDPEYDFAFCIRGAEFKNWKLDKGKTASLRKVKKSNISKRKLVENDILVEISGGGPDQPVGRTVFIGKETFLNLKGHPVVCTNFLRLFRPTVSINAKWLNTYLEFFYQSGGTIPLQAGSNNLRNLKFPMFEEIKIPLPPLPEQRAIVARIEELMSELDHAVSSLQSAQAKLDIYRQAVLKKAFEGSLTENWRTENNEIESRFEVKFGDLCKFTQGIQVPIEDQFEGELPGRVRFLRIIDFTQGNDAPRFIDNPGDKYLVKKDDISMVRYGTVGFVCSGKEGVIANNLFRVIPNERVSKKYLIHFLNSYFFRSHLNPKGATMQALSFGIIKPIPVPIFCLKEQAQIVQEIEFRLLVADKLAETIQTNLQKSEALRQSILKKAFEGRLLSEAELESCRKEADWEPAEKLLARIRQDEAKPKKTKGR